MNGAGRAVLAVAVISFALAGCLATTDNYAVYEPGTSERAKASAKKTSAQATAQVKRASPSQQVTAELKAACVVEHGGLFGGGEKIGRQCDCYAAGMVKTMGQNDLEYYAQYKLIPTLGVAEPASVKKQCGLLSVESADSPAQSKPKS